MNRTEINRLLGIVLYLLPKIFNMGIDYPVICVPTDYEVEGFWPHKDTDLFCVANEFMAETLRPRKVP